MSTTLGDAIREMRDDAGYTLRGLASALVVSPGYLSRIEARGEIPSPEMVLRLAEELDADPEELLAECKRQHLVTAEQRIDERHRQAVVLFRRGR